MIGEGAESRTEWEDGPNHVLLVPSSGYSDLAVRVEWGAGTAVLDSPPPPSSAAAAALSSASNKKKVGGAAGAWGLRWGRPGWQRARCPCPTPVHASPSASLTLPHLHPTLSPQEEPKAKVLAGSKWGGLLG